MIAILIHLSVKYGVFYLFPVVVLALNLCKETPCSHLCLLSPSGFLCACPQGMTLKGNTCIQGKSGKSGKLKMAHLIVSLGKHLQR